MKSTSTKFRQQGSALLVAIIFLVVLGLLGLASMNTSRLELRMANNTEAQATALQAAQALLDAIAAIPAMTPVAGGAGYTLCTPGVAPCNQESIYMPAGPLTALVADGSLFGSAVITAPANSPPPRGLGFSADKFAATPFEATATYDRAEDGLGTATVTEGMILIIPLY
jgi:hypothetical protein